MTAFDAIALSYDNVWTQTAVGDLQRGAVWKLIDPLVCPGAEILDLGCGTGVDALHLRQIGARVYGIDSSPEMVNVARSKGVDADVCKIEDLAHLQGHFDGVISNFGALNCVKALDSVSYELSRLVRPGGFAALCLLSRICVWEIGYYLLRGKARKALRRLSGRAESSYRVRIFYPSRHAVLKTFKDKFVLVAQSGIGFTVPPSYVKCLHRPGLERLAALDGKLAALPLFHSISDHQLFIWRRI